MEQAPRSAREDNAVAAAASPVGATPFAGREGERLSQAIAATAEALRAAGCTLSDAALGDLMRGVAAAPEGEDPAAWLAMLPLPAAPGEALRRSLLDLAAMARGALADGLGDGQAPPVHAARLARLRTRLADDRLDVFLVPRADEHQGEYVPRRAMRLAWLTGFTGSAGMAIVLKERAALFVDGRYTLQVGREVDTALFAPHHLVEEPPFDWLADALGAGMRVGYDPWLLTPQAVERLEAVCRRVGAEIVAVEANPVDAVWDGQAPPPLAPVVVHPTALAGRTAHEKRMALADAVASRGCDAVVLSAPDSIAWLLNIRGGDLPHTPFALGFAVAGRDGSVALFMDERKLPPTVRTHFGPSVAIAPPAALGPSLDMLGHEDTGQGTARVLLDPAGTPAWIAQRLAAAGAEIVHGEDPCQLPKACKTEAELAGARAAHLRDGIAMVRFLAWLTRTAPAGGLTEMDVVARLLQLRRRGQGFRDLSFDTICGAGPNGAIVHYRVTEGTNRAIAPGDILLVDSGAQYRDGTTDITRTIAIGEAAKEPRDRFTRVLKGHIALATARFPEGTSGSQLDALARAPLWQAGLDFDHGTGHGVGSFLSVHEGPQRIAKMPNRVALRPGMIVSNEPGYYKTGAFGIRIENLVAVQPAAALADGLMPFADERQMLSFETLTLCPLDRALIDPGLLSEAETAWVDGYHAAVRQTLAPLLKSPDDEAALDFLEQATAPLVEWWARPGP